MEEEEPRHHQEQRLHMPRLGRESALPLHTGPERKEGQLMSEGALPRDAKGGDNSRPREKGRWEGRAMTGRGWGDEQGWGGWWCGGGSCCTSFFVPGSTLAQRRKQANLEQPVIAATSTLAPILT
jgi:hypothetical protein